MKLLTDDNDFDFEHNHILSEFIIYSVKERQNLYTYNKILNFISNKSKLMTIWYDI